MKELYELFVDELKDMYSSERQIIKALPDLISEARETKLKEALTKHLE